MRHQILPVQIPGEEQEGTLYTYLWSKSEELALGKKRPLILMCPGGGYRRTSDREAEPMALTFMGMGYHVAVLRYSCGENIHYPIALMQLAKAVCMVREHAREWGVISDKIIIQGCSAGGHLAASLGVFWKQREELWRSLNATAEDVRPNGLLLSYPVISSGEFAHKPSFERLLGAAYEREKDAQSLEKYVTSQVPPTFLWHTLTDPTVPVENSLLFLSALHNHKIPVEFHLYPEGGHGLALASRLTMASEGAGIQPACESWIHLAKTWLTRYFPWDQEQ